MPETFKYCQKIIVDGSWYWKNPLLGPGWDDLVSREPSETEMSTVPGYPQGLRYEANILDQLTRLHQFVTGKVVFNAIAQTPYTLTILPYTDTDETSASVCNAFAWEVSPGDFGTKALDKGDAAHTPGPGMNASVHFDVGRWLPGTIRGCRAGYGSIATAPDEILLHEMCHALRAMKGQMNRSNTIGGQSLVQPGYAYDDIEEFFAILVSNMYLSEKGLTTLRQDHHGFAALPKNKVTASGATVDETTNAGFLAAPVNSACMQYLYQTPDTGSLFMNLTGISAVFNPIGEYFNTGTRWKDKYNPGK
jgi:hypothetical protein